ncbi:MAG: VOC family protein [Spirochaetes bacterium]|nr:VOC family protein [Spirochaetota bacterium]
MADTTEKEQKQDTLIPQINQIGIVVRDLEATAKFMEQTFGIKVFVIQMPKANAVLRGREVTFTTKIGLARAGNVDLEFMQLVEGEHLVKEHLETKGPGIHHLGIYVDDLDAAVKKWEEQGGSLIQRTRHPSGIGTAFLDTEKVLGSIYIELIKLK